MSVQAAFQSACGVLALYAKHQVFPITPWLAGWIRASGSRGLDRVPMLGAVPSQILTDGQLLDFGKKELFEKSHSTHFRMFPRVQLRAVLTDLCPPNWASHRQHGNKGSDYPIPE